MSSDESYHSLDKLLGAPANLKIKTDLDFVKTIYNVGSKTPAQVRAALELEIAYLNGQHPGHVLKDVSDPVYNGDGSCTFFITYKKKQ